MYYRNLKSYMFRLYAATFIRLHDLEIYKRVRSKPEMVAVECVATDV
jgi:hypothetical protein